MSKFALYDRSSMSALRSKIKEYFYRKSEVYNKTEIDSMLSLGLKIRIVQTLPQIGESGYIYLVPKDVPEGVGAQRNVYDEYIWIEIQGQPAYFEYIGTTETQVDLSNYYTKSETNGLLDDKVDKVSGKGLSTEDYTTAEKNKLSGIAAGAEVNVQSDWNQSDSTKDDYIKNKPTLRQPASDGTSGQYLKSNGNGNAPSWETMDSAPTENSTKAVTSGGVKTALDGKQASISITTNLNIPTDNDTIVMQDNGNTSTTSFMRRRLSTLWDYIKDKISSVFGIQEGTIDGKVNLLADFTINSIEYSSSNVGKYQKLIRFPRGSTIIINVIRTHTMYGRTDSHTNMFIVDGYSSGSNYVTTLTQSDLRVVNEGNYNFVICPCASYYGSPIFTYRLQILFSTTSIDNIEAVESSVIISASPRDNFIIYNKPVTLGSYTFNMSGSSTNLYLVQGDDHFYSFIGNVTGNVSENYSIYLRDVEIGQIYQFVFTEEIPAGLKFVDDDNYYDACTIPTTIGAGDTLTLTAASATQDGWLYSIQKFEIESPDESIDVKYSNGITKLEVSKRFVKNNAEYYYENDEQIAIGSYAQTLKLTGESGTSRFAYTKNFTLSTFKVDGGSSEYYHILSSGTTYTITIGSTSIQYTPQRTGCLVVVYSGSYDLFGYDLGFFASDNSYDSYYINDLQVNGSNSLCLLDTTSGSILPLLDSQTIVKCWYKNSVVAMCTAVGDMAEATGIYTSAFGYYARAINEHCVAIAYASLAIGINSIAIGSSSKSVGSGSVALGNRSIARNTSCIAIGFNSASTANSSVAIGPNSSSNGNNAVAIGLYSSSGGNYAIAIGNNASSSEVYAIAIGQSANASELRSIAIGYSAQSNRFEAIAIGYNVKCFSSYSVAIGTGSKVDEGGTYSVAIGGAIVDKNSQYSIAIGEGSIAKAVSSMAIGDGAAAYGLNSMFLGKGYSSNERNVGVGINSSVGSINTDSSDNSQYPYLTIRRFDGVPFECDDQIVYNRILSSDATIIVDGHTYMIFAIPNKQIVVVNDSNAENIKYGSATDYNYFVVDGVSIYTQYAQQIAEVNHLHDNYYYIVLSCYDPNYVIGTNSFTFYPLVKSSVNYQNSCVFGNKCFTYHSNSIALGVSCSTAKENQMVIGNFNEINDSSKFIIGGGTEYVRKNILEIDNDERLKVNSAIISGVSSINSSQTQTLNNITKSIYKIKWNGTGTIRLTLGTDGCVEGQRVSIVAVTNDVLIFETTKLVPLGTFGDFLFLDGAWIPSSGILNV